MVHYQNAIKHRKEVAALGKLNNTGKPRVFYLGITAHSNLGDMAQHYCICKWINENYADHDLVMFESNTIVDSKAGFIDKFKEVNRLQDIIVFQSGYTTQDLGGNHEYMHRLIVDNMPYTKILMMPQTIFFEKEENQKRCSESLNKSQHMLFLARDFVSYQMAKSMFPDIHVEAFPDIVTTLIGTLHFDNERKGVCLCTRNDGEKLYTTEQINELATKLEKGGIEVKQKDTQSKQTVKEIRARLKECIESEIETYSHFEITITDRYHGTIFSLCAGTPVIILKTTDHKVTTGADWFKGVYDDYVYVAEDLEDAYNKARMVIAKKLSHQLAPYFKENYYDRLKRLFESE